jgi:hypothetical protein
MRVEPGQDVQEIALAVGGAGELPFPGRREQLGQPVLRADRPVVGQGEAVAGERVGVALLHRQPGSRPAQVDEPDVTERLPGQFQVVRILDCPQRRLGHPQVAAVLRGHAPAIGVPVRQGRERAERRLADEIRHRGVRA